MPKKKEVKETETVGEEAVETKVNKLQTVEDRFTPLDFSNPVKAVNAEYMQKHNRPLDADQEGVKCPKCQGTWWEHKRLARLNDKVAVASGSELPALATNGTGTYHAYSCLACGFLRLPTLTHTAPTVMNSALSQLFSLVADKNEDKE